MRSSSWRVALSSVLLYRLDTRRNMAEQYSRGMSEERRQRIKQRRCRIIPRGGVGDVRHRHHLPTLIGIINVIVIQRPRRGNEKTVITAAVIVGNDVLDHDHYLWIIAVPFITTVPRSCIDPPTRRDTGSGRNNSAPLRQRIVCRDASLDRMRPLNHQKVLPSPSSSYPARVHHVVHDDSQIL